MSLKTPIKQPGGPAKINSVRCTVFIAINSKGQFAASHKRETAIEDLEHSPENGGLVTKVYRVTLILEVPEEYEDLGVIGLRAVSPQAQLPVEKLLADDEEDLH